MIKHSFFDTRPESAHPEIINHLVKYNLDRHVDPADDPNYRLGEKRIKKAFGIPDADIHYFPNGTVTNVTALSAMLKPYEAAICAQTGHINNYETGAFESTGHKILTAHAPDGKLTPEHIEKIVARHHGDYQMVNPKAVYLTQVTEEGTVYTKDELQAIISCARKHGLYVYVDGARLAMALVDKKAGMTMKEFGALDLDMFYIGGGKNGALFGEALVIKNDKFKPDFLSYMKRQGAAQGKPRPLDLQFARFFADDNLWLKLAEHANEMGERLRKGLADAGADLVDSAANHVFAIMKDKTIAELEKEYELARWLKVDDDATKVRLVCGWSTKPEDIDGFVEAVKKLS